MPSVHKARSLLLAGLVAAAVAPVGMATEQARPKPFTVGWAPGAEIVFTSLGPAGVFSIRPDGTGLRRLLSRSVEQPRSSPDGRRLLFSDGRRLFTLRSDGGGLRSLGDGAEPAWSPNGRRIAFYSFAKSGLFVMNADGSGRRLVARASYAQETGPPAWSPNGRRIAFVACTAPVLSFPCEHMTGFDVYTVSATGGNKRRLTHAGGFDQCVAWSSAGKLAFAARDNRIAIVQPSGRLRTFTIAGCPSWAPGGRRLAGSGNFGPVLLSADGSGRRALRVFRRSTPYLGQAVWSPDGRRVAFLSNGKLTVVRTNGTGVKQLFP